MPSVFKERTIPNDFAINIGMLSGMKEHQSGADLPSGLLFRGRENRKLPPFVSSRKVSLSGAPFRVDMESFQVKRGFHSESPISMIPLSLE